MRQKQHPFPDMSLWIKICGNTSLEDALLAANAGADAVGFVFAPSPRRVTVNQVAEITPHMPATLEKIGVFVDASNDEIAAAIRSCSLTGVQLHSSATPEDIKNLRAEFGPALRILRVVHFSPQAAEQAATLAADPNTDAILVDSRTATAVGGTGIAFNWSQASTTLFQNAKDRKVIAAGGLNPANVAEAIATLHPWGVDAVSGVEASPGRKDPIRVREFIANARAAHDLK
jgi:phosphoribosylanthranilate isomerase